MHLQNTIPNTNQISLLLPLFDRLWIIFLALVCSVHMISAAEDTTVNSGTGSNVKYTRLASFPEEFGATGQEEDLERGEAPVRLSDYILPETTKVNARTLEPIDKVPVEKEMDKIAHALGYAMNQELRAQIEESAKKNSISFNSPEELQQTLLERAWEVVDKNVLAKFFGTLLGKLNYLIKKVPELQKENSDVREKFAELREEATAKVKKLSEENDALRKQIRSTPNKGQTQDILGYQNDDLEENIHTVKRDREHYRKVKNRLWVALPIGCVLSAGAASVIMYFYGR